VAEHHGIDTAGVTNAPFEEVVEIRTTNAHGFDSHLNLTGSGVG
jgi:hypothetical protein